MLDHLLRERIRSQGPIPFSEFMRTALYHPESGYYWSHVPGASGDFYTAEQLQPAFGMLLARLARQLRDELALPEAEEFTVVQPGAGSAALAEEFVDKFPFVPIDIGYGQWPQTFSGLVLAHEFFDALPVDVWSRAEEGEGWQELCVGLDGERFVWQRGKPVTDASMLAMVDAAEIPEQVERIEVMVGAQQELGRLAAHLESGYLLVLDYGVTNQELLRFPQGTLLSYFAQQAVDDVLLRAGEQDITAHVNYSQLRKLAAAQGFTLQHYGTLGQLLLRLGKEDHFAAVLASHPQAQQQLKSLLFDFGETFHAYLFKK